MKLALKEKIWIGTFIGLWLIVSSVSTLHSVEFFKLSNSVPVSWFLALAFELGAIASLGGLVISRGSKWLIWTMFSILTAFQIHCNMYWCWVNAEDLTQWINLLDLIDEESNFQLRIFAAISGGILPVLALGFTKSLMDYLNPSKLEPVVHEIESFTENEQEENVNTIEVLEDSNLKVNKQQVTDYSTGSPIIKEAFDNLSPESEERAKQLTDYVESQDTFDEYMGEDMSDEEVDQHIHSNGKDLLKDIEEQKTDWDDIVKPKEEPFWAKLDPKKTVKVLDANQDYIENELPKGNKNKS